VDYNTLVRWIRERRMKMVIQAKYEGTCRKCGGPIAVGDTIEWEKGRGAAHAECPAQEEAPYSLGGGSGYGCNGWEVGATMRVNRDNSRYADWPEYVTVVRSGSTYYREDGMSFGVGDESGYCYWAECREATEAEAAPIRDKRERGERAKQAAARLDEIKTMIRTDGDRPGSYDEQVTPEGRTELDTRNIYGGGEWLVIGTEYIWCVRNNGSDGDDWSRNNVRTGGAGAIGWRIPATTELLAEIDDLVAIIKEGKS